MSYVDEVRGADQGPGVQLGGISTTGTDIPVNPYSLLEAVNGSSAAARGGWVLFLAITTFILVAVAGVSHVDLLLNSKVDLPILQVEIELTRFFLFAPILLLFVHFGMLIQHVMLSRKTLEFDRSIRAMEPTRRATHPLRLELHSYFFTQALAGPQRGWLLASFLHAMVWISLVVLPVMIMLFTQVVFLPYHDLWITWIHRIVLSLDMAILLAVGVFLRRTEASFFVALARSARRHPTSFVITGSLFAVVFVLSFFVATIPGETLDKLRPKPVDENAARQAGASQSFSFSAAEFFSRSRDDLKWVLESMFSRNLIVNNADLVKNDDESVKRGEVSLVLRDRDFQNATLNRIDLHHADLAGADLRGAKLIEADLRRVDLTCSTKRCAMLDGADLTKAKLHGAKLERASLKSATLYLAQLPGVELSNADLTSANLRDADLRRARIQDGATFVGAQLRGANLQGAYFLGVNMHGADLSNAKLQGAFMPWLMAYGANLSSAKLDGAYLDSAKLQGADLSNASLAGTHLANATIWLTVPPNRSQFLLTHTDGVTIEAPGASDIEGFNELMATMPEAGSANILARQRMTSLMEEVAAQRWQDDADNAAWQKLKVAGAFGSTDYRRRITSYLGLLACQERWKDGAVADGVIARAATEGFGGDTAQIYSHITDDNCPASKELTPDLQDEIIGVIEVQENKLAESLASEAALQTGEQTETSTTVEPAND